MSDQPRMQAGNPAAQPYVDQLRRQELHDRAVALRSRIERLADNIAEHQQAVGQQRLTLAPLLDDLAAIQVELAELQA